MNVQLCKWQFYNNYQYSSKHGMKELTILMEFEIFRNLESVITPTKWIAGAQLPQRHRFHPPMVRSQLFQFHPQGLHRIPGSRQLGHSSLPISQRQEAGLNLILGTNDRQPHNQKSIEKVQNRQKYLNFNKSTNLDLDSIPLCFSI